MTRALLGLAFQLSAPGLLIFPIEPIRGFGVAPPLLLFLGEKTPLLIAELRHFFALTRIGGRRQVRIVL